ncbi:MAG: hypothetical protein O3A07_07335 [Bacteroidetes bacterium]|jgi:hypothetical protein|nr:hypothetical protein [Bacteroidota bacterium]
MRPLFYSFLYIISISLHQTYGQFDRGQGQPIDKGLAFGQWDGPVADLFSNIRTDPNGLNGALKNVKGSPYFEAEYREGMLYKGEEAIQAAKYFRYNAYLDEIELSNVPNPPTSSSQVLLKLEYISCEINGMRYEVRDYFDSKKQIIQKGFFVPIHQSENLEVLLQRQMEYREGRPAKTSLEIPIPARFIAKQNFYIRYQNGPLEPLNPNKRSVTKLLKKYQLLPERWPKVPSGSDEASQLKLWLAHLN